MRCFPFMLLIIQQCTLDERLSVNSVWTFGNSVPKFLHNYAVLLVSPAEYDRQCVLQKELD